MKTNMKVICEYFGFSKAGYYKHQQLVERHKEEDAYILERVKAIRSLLPKSGTRKICKMLEREHVYYARDRMFNLLRENNMLVRNERRRFVTTVGSLSEPKPNLMEDLILTHVNQAWGTDITYINTSEGVIYLSVIMDLKSRHIIAWHASNDLLAISSLIALQKAVATVKIPLGIIHHSDRGGQYLSKAYQQFLLDHGMLASNTGKNHCYDNATVERFHNTLKNEFGIGQKLLTKAETIINIDKTIDLYNNMRLHESLGYLTPAEVYYAA